DTHYGPAPWLTGGPRADWTSVYYNRADTRGIGVDRTATGSNAVAQYAPPVAAPFADLARVPDPLLLWVHHVPWDYRLASGRTLWEELVMRYTRGVGAVGAMRRTWSDLAGKVDAERYRDVRPSSPSRNRKPPGGAMRASPISRASRTDRCRRAT